MDTFTQVRRLHTLSGLTRLCYNGQARELGSLLRDYPNSTSILREIRISHGFVEDLHISWEDSVAAQASAFVALATELTALTRMWCSAAACPKWLSFILASCPRQLAWLELPDRQTHQAFTGLPAAIQQLTTLRTLRIGTNQSELWEDLVPRLTSLPHLMDLAEVPMQGRAALKAEPWLLALRPSPA